MPLQFQFYLDTPEGRRMGGDTISYKTATIDFAARYAEAMLQEHIFPFGKANLCIIKDRDGHVIREVRGK